MIKTTLKSIVFRISKKHPFLYLGRLLLFLFPKLSNWGYKNYFPANHKGILPRAIMLAVEEKYSKLSEPEQRQMIRYAWGEGGGNWHTKKAERSHGDANFQAEYLRSRGPLIDYIKSDNSNGHYRVLCEIGSGNGLFLSYLSTYLTDIDLYCGLDLNPKMIEECQQKYRSGKYKFINMEAAEYVKKHIDQPTILLSCITLSYLTQKEIETLLSITVSVKHALLFCIYDVVDMDLDIENDSKLIGHMSYSHNYPFLFKKYGYSIKYMHLIPRPDSSVREIILISEKISRNNDIL